MFIGDAKEMQINGICRLMNDAKGDSWYQAKWVIFSFLRYLQDWIILNTQDRAVKVKLAL